MFDRYQTIAEDAPEYVILRRSMQKASRDHKCTACGKTIPKGEKYARIAGTCDGEFFNDAMHDFNANCVSYI